MTPEIREQIRARIVTGEAGQWDAAVLWQELERKALPAAAASPQPCEERDPRLNPMPGDVVRIGGTYGGSWIEVITRDPRLRASDVSYIGDGVERGVSLAVWRNAMYRAEVIVKAENRSTLRDPSQGSPDGETPQAEKEVL